MKNSYKKILTLYIMQTFHKDLKIKSLWILVHEQTGKPLE